MEIKKTLVWQFRISGVVDVYLWAAAGCCYDVGLTFEWFAADCRKWEGSVADLRRGCELRERWTVNTFYVQSKYFILKYLEEIGPVSLIGQTSIVNI